MNSKLVATSVYEELTVKQTEAEKVSLLRDQLSQRCLLRGGGAGRGGAGQGRAGQGRGGEGRGTLYKTRSL